MVKKRGIESYILSRKAKISIQNLVPDPENVRDKYSHGDLVVLADSIASSGQLQPILVEKIKGKYHIVAGHRRYWASLFAEETGWMDRGYILAKVVRKLPRDLRLRVQLAENECKAPVPKDNLANLFWRRYKLCLVDQIEDIDETSKEIIHLATNFYEIPSELTRNLPISVYAKSMGFGVKAVSRAFSYQKLNADIKNQVANHNNRLSYSAACVLSQILNKNEQRRILGNVRKENVPTRFHISEAVRQYFESIEREKETGTFMITEKNGKSRSGNLKELSVYLGRANRLVQVLESVESLVGNVKNLEIRTNGAKTTPEKIVMSSYSSFKKCHGTFLQNYHYRHLWEFAPKRFSLLDFIRKNARDSSDKSGGNVMDLVESKILPVRLIKPNPLNPRGEKRDFDEVDLEILADSIKEEGLIQDILVMKYGREYITLEGHRRSAALELLAKTEKNIEIGALVIPTLTEEQQEKVMCDSDLFEQISLDAQSRAIARQYRLENRGKLSENALKRFIEKYHRWPARVIRNSISYDRLPEEVKKLQAQGIITYGAAIEISKINNQETQIDFAVSSAILGQSKHDIRKSIELGGQEMLFDKNDLDMERRKAELKFLASELTNTLEGVQERVNTILKSNYLLSKFKKDDYLIRKFQSLMKTLEELNS